jgi:hypothetical protein
VPRVPAQSPFLPMVWPRFPASFEPAALFRILRGAASMGEATRERNRSVNELDDDELFAKYGIER